MSINISLSTKGLFHIVDINVASFKVIFIFSFPCLHFTIVHSGGNWFAITWLNMFEVRWINTWMGPNDKAICVRGGRDMVSTGSGVLRMEIWRSERTSGHSPGTNKIGFLQEDFFCFLFTWKLQYWISFLIQSPNLPQTLSSWCDGAATEVCKNICKLRICTSADHWPWWRRWWGWTCRGWRCWGCWWRCWGRKLRGCWTRSWRSWTGARAWCGWWRTPPDHSPPSPNNHCHYTSDLLKS